MSIPTRSLVIFGAILLSLVEFRGVLAQTFTINSVTASRPSFGNVGAALNGVTVFRISPSGVVSVVSGNGGDTPSGTQGAATVNIRCSNPNCSTGTAIVKIGARATVSGRANAVSNFTVASGTATVGAVTVNGDGTIQFPVTGLANNSNRTIFVGMDLPIVGDNASSSTTATAQWTVAVAKSPTVPSLPGTTGTAMATVRKSISASTTALAFGAIRQPNSGSGTVTINATSGARSSAGGVVLVPGMGSGRGTIVVAGQPNTSFTITTPSSFTLTNGSTTLTSTVTRTATGTLSLNASGAYTLGIGGVMTVPNGVTAGDYSGAITATVAYN